MKRPAYVSKRTPRAKQAEALNASACRVVFGYLMAMRTGKTKVTLDDFGRVEAAGECDDFLLIAPAGVYKTWLNMNEDGSLFGTRAKDKGKCAIVEDWPDQLIERAAFHVWESGSYGSKKKPNKRRQAELQEFLAHDGPRVLVVNVEALSSVEMARELVIEFCSRKGRRVYCAIDESTCVKNPTAERSKFIVFEVAPLTSHRRILSGLLTPKSPMDLYAQFAFLDKKILGHNKFTTFRARYAVTQTIQVGKRWIPLIVGFRDVPELAEKIRPHTFRVRLEDCYDMPPATWAIRDVQLTEKQAKMYDDMKRYATAQIEGELYVTSTVVIAQLNRMHQLLCGFTTDEAGGFHELPENRTDELVALLEEYDGKAIIWCSYDYSIRKVSAALEKEFGKGSVARFWGGNRKTREAEEAEFKTNPACRFMVATASAGGKGRTWDMADLVVYYSSSPDLEHRSQSEERPKGVGKTKSIHYVDLQAAGTIEMKYVHSLRNKIDMAAVINGDNYKEWLV